jgi:hypothetical protein
MGNAERKELWKAIWHLIERFESASGEDECIAKALDCLEYATEQLDTKFSVPPPPKRNR